MAKLTDIIVSTKSKDDYIGIRAKVTVSSKGEFVATVSGDELLKLKEYLPDMPENDAKVTFRSDTYTKLEALVKDFLLDSVSCELTEKKDVIRYCIETTCHYCEGDEKDNYEVYPNGSWLPKHLLEEHGLCSRWRGGTEDMSSYMSSPYSLKLYCEVFEKCTYRYKNGRETTTYSHSPCVRFQNNEVTDSVSWLKSLVHMGPERGMKITEVEATEENAAVFVQLIKFICKANRIMKILADPEGLLDFVENNCCNILEFHHE